jgi:mono/diheme cytochrome c family protein
MKFFFYTAAIVTFSISYLSFIPQQDAFKASMERGKKVYESTCLPCHQSKGSGVPGMNPPLVKTKYVLGVKDTLIGIVLNGLDEEVEINGQTYANPMPGQPQLKNQEIADVLTYVRNSFGNQATAVTVEEVNKLRNK